ncbi:uncharacterized protein LOC131430769 [Malaya genurostris]|uniref:uncharacterized protein LOC131430769 n=1 Tax=Malaya genurostris TaxID=325434 RepID=UPI0026F3BFC6|nr:uncharacterized protein LOC131430769 [Malaya genurostris]
MFQSGNMQNIDTEKFIDEVRMRRALWDRTSEEYRDKTLRFLHWEDLCTVMIPEFGGMTPSDKLSTVLEVQKKWRQLRTALNESLKLSDNRRRPFVSEENLSFLKSPAKQTIDSDCKDDDSRQPRQTNCVQKKYKRWDESEDMHFFRTLLPLIRPLSVRQKMKFRMEAMKRALEFSENIGSSCSQTPAARVPSIPRESVLNTEHSVPTPGLIVKRSPSLNEVKIEPGLTYKDDV